MQLLRCLLAVRVLVVAAECVWLISKEIEMSTNDGGNAFPVADYDHMAFQPATVDEHKRQLSGMSLRDYFAAKFAAAQATMTSADSNFINPDYVWPAAGEAAAQSVAQKIARTSYSLADAMLAERSK
jgi:hypothetical protein